MCYLSLNYLLPVVKNKTSETGFVLGERKCFGVVFWGLGFFFGEVFFTVKGVLIPQNYIFF